MSNFQFSGRKFVTVALVSTYCLVIILALILTLFSIMKIDVLLALISGLSGHVIYVVKAYYDDKDRTLTSTTKGE